MRAAFVFCFLGNGVFKLESSFLWVSYPLGPIHGCLPWWQQWWTVDSWYHLGKKGSELANSWEGRSLPLVFVPFTISEERSEEKNRVATNKSWNCLRNGPFSEAFKATLSQSLAGTQYWAWVSAKHGLNLLLPNCCLYLPRLTNWTFFGLTALPENWSYCYLLLESFHRMCQKLDPSCGWFPSSVQVALFLSGMLLLLLVYFCCVTYCLFSSNPK